MRGQPFAMAVWVLVAAFPVAGGDGLIDSTRKREADTPNLEASLAVHEWYKGGVLSQDSPFKSKSASPVPPRDSEVRYTIALQLSGNKVRVENGQSIWHLETGALHPNPTVSVTNGTVS